MTGVVREGSGGSGSVLFAFAVSVLFIYLFVFPPVVPEQLYLCKGKERQEIRANAVA